ncbi:MAG: nucleotidyltransferase domain-containing protein [Deltaproteobacteria bacterium]|jgi:predicted nucleotidyltransferase|nr:nucleotidyltransferase domain-containing protein [Deltaproteobacteria bacterium]
MIYTLEQIKELVAPIAEKYKLKALWVFGSYARGEATEASDVDFLIDYTDSTIVTLLDFNRIDNEFEEVINRKIDLISTNAVFNRQSVVDDPEFVNSITRDRKIIYGKS